MTQADVPTVSIRINGAPHDFMMLNLRSTQAATTAVDQAIHTLRTALHGTDTDVHGRNTRWQPGTHIVIVTVVSQIEW